MNTDARAPRRAAETSADELRLAVAAAAADTPYRVEPTDEGFDLRIDITDARWLGLFATVGRKTVVENHVVLDADTRTLQITDEYYDVRWSAGSVGRTPRLVARARATHTRGRSWSVSREWTWRTGVGATPVPVAVHRFTSAEAHKLIRSAASELGWRERPGLYERVGLLAALAGGAVLIAMCWVAIVGGRH